MDFALFADDVINQITADTIGQTQRRGKVEALTVDRLEVHVVQNSLLQEVGLDLTGIILLVQVALKDLTGTLEDADVHNVVIENLVNIQPVLDLLEKGYIPVISTIGCDAEGNSYNINSDTATAHIAAALGAERLIMMTDIAGILRDKDDPSTLIPELTITEAHALREQGVISGGMIPKVECCIQAIRQGVKKVIIMDGRVPHSILMELLTDEGAGTMVRGAQE